VALSDDLIQASRAKVLILDIETQRAITEVWTTYKPFITIDNVIVDARVLCFAAKWRGKDKVIFKSCWRDPVSVNGRNEDAEQEYRQMMQAAWDLLNECDILVTYNGDRFDWQWLEREFTRLGMARPLPYRSQDLMKVNKKWFKAGQLSLKLDWSLRKLLGESKIAHGGVDLWHEIRYGSAKERRAACKAMREYNIHDARKTEQLFEHWLPYLPLNMALYGDRLAADDGLLHCTKCDSTNLHRQEGAFVRTGAYGYQLYRCVDCGAVSRGKRSKITTELRPV